MEISTIVSIGINALFAIELLAGVLYGFKRGWKKALLRFGILIAMTVVISFVSPYITKALFGISIDGTPLMDYIKNMVLDESLKQVLATNTSIAQYVDGAIISVANLVVFIVANILATILGYFIWLIVSAIIFRKEKQEKKEYNAQRKLLKKNKETEDAAILIKPKKNKLSFWFGGLIGLVQSIVLMFVIFLPVNGIVDTYNDIMADPTAPAVVETGTEMAVGAFSLSLDEGETSAASSNALPESVSQLLQDAIPTEVSDIINAYSTSALKVVNGLFDFDKLCFDSISRFDVSGETVHLRKDIEEIVTIYDKFAPIYNTFTATNDLSNLDFDKISAILDDLFELSSIKAVANDLVPYAIDQFIINGEGEMFGAYDADIKEAIRLLMDEYETSDNVVVGLKEDFKNFADIAKIVVESDIISKIDSENIILEAKILFEREGNAQSYFERIADKVSSRRFVIFSTLAMNIAYETLNDELALSGTDRIQLYDYNKINGRYSFENDKTFLNDFLANLIDIYDVYGEDPAITTTLITKAQTAFDNLERLSIFSRMVPNALCAIIKDNANIEMFNEELDARINKMLSEEIAVVYKDSNKISGDINTLLDLALDLGERGLFEIDFDDLSAILDFVNGDTADSEPLLDSIVDSLASTNGLVFGLREAVNILIYNINKILDIAKDDPSYIEYIEMKEASAIKNNKESLKKFLSYSSDIYSDVGEGFDFKTSDISSIATLLNFLQEDSYVINDEVLGARKENTLFADIYGAFVNYFCNIDAFGEKIASIVKDSDNNIKYVNWISMFELVKQAQTISRNGINPDNIGGLINAIKDNEAIADAAKDVIQEFVGDMFEESDMDAVFDSIKEVGSATEIQDVANVISDLTAVVNGTDGEVDTGVITEQINNLVESEAITNVIESVADLITSSKDESIKDSFDVSGDIEKTEQINEIINGIDNTGGANDDLINKLRSMFNIG